MIDRQYPHQVQVLSKICEGHNYEPVHAFANALPSYSRHSGSWHVVNDQWELRFAFGDPADADKFRERFGGRRLTVHKIGGRWRDDFL
jgi:hypothetical protein